MDPVAIGLIALAAVLHAVWNILLKAADDPLRMAAAGVAAASVVLVPIVVVGWLTFGQPSVPPQAWALGITSGGVEVLYFAFLAAAFRRGDLSVVYPLARGTAPLLAIAIGIGVLGERLAPAAWLGVGLLLAGLLLVQRPWRLLRSAASSNDRAAAGFALLTGATIAVYSALDTVGVSLTPVWVYAGILWPTCMVGLGVLVFARKRVGGGRFAPPETPIDIRTAAVGGILTFSAYALVLAALSRAPLAVVAPLRESAIVLTSLWGVLRLREATGTREVSIRIAGSVLVLAGAITLAIAG
ncbi:MAG TPA: EamA family transporter [Candidatus Limnocylindrales bacterium]